MVSVQVKFRLVQLYRTLTLARYLGLVRHPCRAPRIVFEKGDFALLLKQNVELFFSTRLSLILSVPGRALKLAIKISLIVAACLEGRAPLCKGGRSAYYTVEIVFVSLL